MTESQAFPSILCGTKFVTLDFKAAFMSAFNTGVSQPQLQTTTHGGCRRRQLIGGTGTGIGSQHEHQEMLTKDSVNGIGVKTETHTVFMELPCDVIKCISLCDVRVASILGATSKQLLNSIIQTKSDVVQNTINAALGQADRANCETMNTLQEHIINLAALQTGKSEKQETIDPKTTQLVGRYNDVLMFISKTRKSFTIMIQRAYGPPIEGEVGTSSFDQFKSWLIDTSFYENEEDGSISLRFKAPSGIATRSCAYWSMRDAESAVTSTFTLLNQLEELNIPIEFTIHENGDNTTDDKFAKLFIKSFPAYTVQTLQKSLDAF